MERGSKFQGTPCKRGHSGIRYTKSRACVECAKFLSRRWDKNNPARYLELKRRRNRAARGIPEPTTPRPATCEVCGKPPANHTGLCVDHDHETGEFRGWLCHTCNRAIGMLGDNAVALRSALEYLERASST